MAKVQVTVHEDGIRDLLKDQNIRHLMMMTGNQVAAQASSTADAAENGPEGTITGYASAGFSTKWVDDGGRRPRVEVNSNAPLETAVKVFFHTMKRDGVDHLRAALYSVTTKKNKRG